MQRLALPILLALLLGSLTTAAVALHAHYCGRFTLSDRVPAEPDDQKRVIPPGMIGPYQSPEILRHRSPTLECHVVRVWDFELMHPIDWTIGFRADAG